MVGVCFEVHDAYKLKAELKEAKQDMEAILATNQSAESMEETSDYAVKKRSGNEENKPKVDETKAAIDRYEDLQLKLKYEEIDPSVVDLIHYAFNYCGILTGTVTSNILHSSYFLF